MRSEIHLRDGVAVLLLVLMIVLVTIPVRRDNSPREPATWHAKEKMARAHKASAS